MALVPINSRAAGAGILALVFCGLLAKGTSETRVVYRLFPEDFSCSCIVAKKKTKTVEGSEVTVRDKVFQVFKDCKSKRELFRVYLGSPKLKWWHYGISLEGDFNGDGVPDYSWYGGDDTSDELYVFLSSDGAYKKLNVYKTFEAEWARTFHKRVPDFAGFGQDGELQNIRFLRESGGLILAAEYASVMKPVSPKRKLRVRSENFVFGLD